MSKTFDKNCDYISYFIPYPLKVNKYAFTESSITNHGYSLDYLRKVISDLGYGIYNIENTLVKDGLTSRECYLV